MNQEVDARDGLPLNNRLQNSLNLEKYDVLQLLENAFLKSEHKQKAVDCLVGILEEMGYELNPKIPKRVRILKDPVYGFQGVKIAEREVPDLIIMDVKMPKEDGIGAFEKLIQLDITSKIPVIFMTASHPIIEIENQVLKMGAKSCIAKPFISEDLEQALAMAFA